MQEFKTLAQGWYHCWNSMTPLDCDYTWLFWIDLISYFLFPTSYQQQVVSVLTIPSDQEKCQHL